MRLLELTIARANAPSSQQGARGEAEGNRTRSGHEVARLRSGAAHDARLSASRQHCLVHQFCPAGLAPSAPRCAYGFTAAVQLRTSSW